MTIYLESGENTYGDASVMGSNLLSDLDDATRGWQVDEAAAVEAGWTMGRLVGT